MVRHDARPDGARRHLRPARRRLPPLLRRRALARAALREDALRQRAARLRSTSRPSGSTGDAVLPPGRRGDARLRPARDDRPRGRLLLHAGRRQRGRGGQVLRLDARTRSRRCWAPMPRKRLRYWGVDQGPNFEGQSILGCRASPIPPGGSRPADACGRRASSACIRGVTTRSWRPGTAWPAVRWPRPAGPWTGPTTLAPPGATPSSCSAPCARTAGCCGPGRPGGPSSRDTSRTTP